MEENSAMLSFFKRIGVVHWEFQQISQRRWASALFVLEWFELVNRSLVDIINAFHDNQPTGEDLELAEIWSTYLLNLQQCGSKDMLLWNTPILLLNDLK